MNNNNTLVTSSGIIKNRLAPRVGVISAYRLFDELFDECVQRGTDLTFEEYRTETIARLKAEHPSLDDSDLDDLFDSESECVDFDTRTFLLGAWVKGPDGTYSIDKSGARGTYALTYNTGTNTVCVEWGVKTVLCGHTSPCYVMADGSGPCGDLSAQGDSVLAYTLPSDMFQSGE